MGVAYDIYTQMTGALANDIVNISALEDTGDHDRITQRAKLVWSMRTAIDS